MQRKDSIQSLERYFRLRELFEEYKSGSSGFFAGKLNITRRTFYRYLKYMIKEDGMKISYDRKRHLYRLEEE